ncbi:MAG: VWA domain-containing protein, partial [Intrasporangium sp.]|uniref:vWA domain-containing protein n=1 Tax=Intrasporangium sp. TaxID=1925024 RepID=UPI002648EDAA
GPPPGPAGGGGGPGAPRPGPRRPRPRSKPGDRQVGRGELATAPGFERISPAVGQVDEDALREALSDDVAGTVTVMARMRRATDPALRAAAERLSAQLIFDRVARVIADRPGVHRRTASRGRLDGDLDVDASLEAIAGAHAERRPVSLDDLTMTHWGRGTLALVLLVDQSGSMTGERLAHATVLAAACALRMPDELAVLAFGRDVVTLRGLHDPAPGQDVVDRVLRLVGHGETGLSQALTRAAEVLAGSRASRRVVVLLSDCRASGPGEDGTDAAVRAAAAIDELCVLAPASDCDQARDLALAVGAAFAELGDPASAPALLEELLTRTP